MGYIMDLRKLVGNRPIVTVGASAVILDRDSSVLLIKRNDNNLWALPAGSTEINENPQTTAIREIQEETGLLVNEDDLTLIQVFGGEDFFYTYPNGDQWRPVF